MMSSIKLTAAITNILEDIHYTPQQVVLNLFFLFFILDMSASIHRMKILILGSQESHRQELLNKIIKSSNGLIQNRPRTKEIVCKQGRVMIEFVQANFDSNSRIFRNLLKQQDGLILVYNVENKNSFAELGSIVSKLKFGFQSQLKLLLGFQLHGTERIVSTQLALGFALENCLMFEQISGQQSQTQVDQVLQRFCEEIFIHKNPTQKISQQDEQASNQLKDLILESEQLRQQNMRLELERNEIRQRYQNYINTEQYDQEDRKLRERCANLEREIQKQRQGFQKKERTMKEQIKKLKQICKSKDLQVAEYFPIAPQKIPGDANLKYEQYDSFKIDQDYSDHSISEQENKRVLVGIFELSMIEKKKEQESKIVAVGLIKAIGSGGVNQ